MLGGDSVGSAGVGVGAGAGAGAAVAACGGGAGATLGGAASACCSEGTGVLGWETATTAVVPTAGLDSFAGGGATAVVAQLGVAASLVGCPVVGVAGAAAVPGWLVVTAVVTAEDAHAEVPLAAEPCAGAGAPLAGLAGLVVASAAVVAGLLVPLSGVAGEDVSTVGAGWLAEEVAQLVDGAPLDAGDAVQSGVLGELGGEAGSVADAAFGSLLCVPLGCAVGELDAVGTVPDVGAVCEPVVSSARVGAGAGVGSAARAASASTPTEAAAPAAATARQSALPTRWNPTNRIVAGSSRDCRRLQTQPPRSCRKATSGRTGLSIGWRRRGEGTRHRKAILTLNLSVMHVAKDPAYRGPLEK
jgi:hypothetical protein